MDKNDIIVKLGFHLRKLRKERNLTQAQVAYLMGKDRQSYQRIELGNTNPTLGYLLQVASAFNISFVELFSFLEKD